MIARIQVRRDSSGNWTLNDPILTLGEIGYETDTEKFKVGDGSSNWSNLNYELGQWKSDSSGNITYGAQAGEGDVFIQNSLVVTGDLTVNGQTTTINTEEVTIEDNMVLLNSNLVIAPPSTLESGIEVNLGTSGSTKLYWDQATLKWTVEGDLNVEGDIYSNNIVLWRLNGDDIYFDGGNVGIGAANSTNSRLDIVGDSASVGVAVALNDTNGSGKTYSLRSDAGSLALRDIDAGADRFVIESNGDPYFYPTQDMEIRADVDASVDVNIRNYSTGTNASCATVLVPDGNNFIMASYNDNHASRANENWLFSTATGSDVVFGTNATERMRIDSSGKVGIGTSSPDEKLHIEVPATNTAAKFGAASGGDSFGITPLSAGNGTIIGSLNDANNDYEPLNMRGEFLYFSTRDSANVVSEKMRIDSSGNVGIGTSLPSSPLHVVDNTAVYPQTLASFGNSDENSPFRIVSSSNTEWGLQSYNSRDIIFENRVGSGTPSRLMTIKNDGNVGIGTNSPDQDLFGAAKVLHLSSTNVASLRLESTHGSGADFEIAASNSQSDVFIHNKSNNGDLILGAGNAERMRIDSSGNVGIGTSSPSAKLEVESASGAGNTNLFRLIRDGGYGDTTFNQWYTNGAGTPSGGNPTALYGLNMGLVVDSANNGKVAVRLESQGGSNTIDDSIVFRTANSDKVFIKSSGNVGIGTSAPSEKLHVNGGSLRVDIGTTPDSAAIFSGGGSNLHIDLDNGYTTFRNTAGSTSNQGFRFKATSTSNDLVTIQNDGNVGIGTSSPSEKLEVSGAINLGTTTSTNAGTIRWTGSDFQGYTGPTDGWQSLLTPSGLVSSQWTTSGSNIYYNTGNVGIGTSSPTAKLDVENNANSETLIRVDNSTDGTASASGISLNPSGSNAFFKSYADSHSSRASTVALGSTATGTELTFFTQDNERMRIKADGRVGIGVNPVGNLDVGGQIPSALASAANTIGVSGGTQGRFYVAGSNQAGMIQEDTGATANNKVTQLVTYGDTFRIVNLTDIYGTKSTSILVDKSTGFVGINKTSASEALDVSGNITATGTISSSSDITLKENIETISDPIEKVKEISGYTFNKKGEDLRLVGLIAQEVEKVLPEAVVENNEGLKSVAYGNMVALLIECVKKQDERIDQLEKTIEKMK